MNKPAISRIEEQYQRRMVAALQPLIDQTAEQLRENLYLRSVIERINDNRDKPEVIASLLAEYAQHLDSARARPLGALPAGVPNQSINEAVYDTGDHLSRSS